MVNQQCNVLKYTFWIIPSLFHTHVSQSSLLVFCKNYFLNLPSVLQGHCHCFGSDPWYPLFAISLSDFKITSTISTRIRFLKGMLHSFPPPQHPCLKIYVSKSERVKKQEINIYTLHSCKRGKKKRQVQNLHTIIVIYKRFLKYRYLKPTQIYSVNQNSSAPKSMLFKRCQATCCKATLGKYCSKAQSRMPWLLTSHNQKHVPKS